MDSMDGAHRAEANGFLYEQVTNRMSARKGSNAAPAGTYVLRFAFGFALLIGLNVVALNYSATSSELTQQADYPSPATAYNY